MKTLFNKHLCEREFGNTALQTSALLKWAEVKGLLLRTSPPLDEYEIVQVESLLCAIERGATELSPDDARAVIDCTPLLAKHDVAERFVEPDRTHVWLVGSEAHRQWRELITKAIADGELQLLDGVSLLPIAPTSGAPEKVAPPALGALPAEKKSDGPAWYDIEQETGCRRLILENWKTIVQVCGPKAKASQILRQLKIIHGPQAQLPTQKTIHNCRKALFDEKLIP